MKTQYSKIKIMDTFMFYS